MVKKGLFFTCFCVNLLEVKFYGWNYITKSWKMQGFWWKFLNKLQKMHRFVYQKFKVRRIIHIKYMFFTKTQWIFLKKSANAMLLCIFCNLLCEKYILKLIYTIAWPIMLNKIIGNIKYKPPLAWYSYLADNYHR